VKRLLRKICHATPTGVRKALNMVRPIADLRRRYFESDTLLHDDYYTDHYYEHDVLGPAMQSAPRICRAIIERFRPADVIDVGCGTGDYLAAFREAGIEGHGIELASAALKRCREKGLDVARIDLMTARELPWRADLVYSFEVAEHIPESAAVTFVRAIAASAKKHVVI
jgi:predicted TPR repeat methyltransferase